jgi:hypothetical protein
MAKAAIFTSGALTFARRQFASRPVCGIRLRPRAIVKPLIRQDKVNAAIARRLNAFVWRIDIGSSLKLVLTGTGKLVSRSNALRIS